MMPGFTDLPDRDPGLPRFLLAALAIGLLAALRLLLGSDLPESGSSRLAAAVASPIPADPRQALAQAGAEVFLAQGCGACHATTDASTASGPGLGGVAARAGLRPTQAGYGGAASSAEAYLREAVVDHCVDTLPGYACVDMPEIGLRLGGDSLDALVVFLLRLTPEGSP